MKEDEPAAAEEKTQLAYAAIGVATVCLLVGVPLWWKTTTVYRVNLPYDDMYALIEKKLEYTTPFTVVYMGENPKKQDLATFAKELRKTMLSSGRESEITAVYRGNVRRWFEEEKQLFTAAVDVNDFTEKIEAAKLIDDIGRYKFYIFPLNNKIKLSRYHITNRQNIYISEPDDWSGLADEIKVLMNNVLVNEDLLENSYQTAKGHRLSLKPDKDSMRSVGYHPNYDLTFTLINPQPDIIRVSWNIETAVKNYLNPFLQAMQEYSTFSVKSQVLYYTSISVRPSKDNAANCFYLKPHELPHLINPIERDLASFASKDPSLNFILYIPYRGHSPLHIYTAQGKPASTNAFLSPRWGGVVIENVPNPKNRTQLPSRETLNMQPIMGKFIEQLRQLIGIQTRLPYANIEFQSAGITAVTQWELNIWLRKRTIENIATSAATLKSLADLLGKIKNMVINDDIGNEVQLAVDSVTNAHQHLKQGLLRDAFEASKQALQASEKAFFDPSLLELLYFPEDQKFAIYIPLFLPISLPILTSLYSAFKYFRGRNQQKQKSS
ncbi:GPI-anchor transamidase component PIGS-like [Tubulanus polymorphus]|uniref:GPI-anchor transamidase component PIGS-like n=1 Tax=Tubulanus polymorphus TaxID=672921 RepID=UPI003DA279A9